ncbi:MAG: dTDP-4-dehydrorhamnose 3,5-epimerase [Caulobacterales bacterium]
MIEVTVLALPEVKLVRLSRHADARGSFMETYSAPHFAAACLPDAWVQDNEVYSQAAGTVRGLHFQVAPHGQGKLVRALSGRILDVAVDVRPQSANFGRHVAVVLNAERSEALFIPEGFAHGYCTLSLDTLVQYKVTRPYAPEAERALFWADPDLGIAWPVSAGAAVVSPRDAQAPSLAALKAGL